MTAIAAAGVSEGLVVLATEQRAGRGRLGRDWVSAPGGVYASVLLRPSLSPAELSPLALVVGGNLAADADMRDRGHKWPNDVLDQAGGGKLAGILLEGMTEGERMAWIVAGFGVNVRRSATPGVSGSIAATPEPPTAPAPAYLDDLLI